MVGTICMPRADTRREEGYLRPLIAGRLAAYRWGRGPLRL
jgi:hypothetical protein